MVQRHFVEAAFGLESYDKSFVNQGLNPFSHTPSRGNFADNQKKNATPMQYLPVSAVLREKRVSF